MNKRIIKLTFLFSVFFIFFYFFPVNNKNILADNQFYLSGYAWSDNIGWISFDNLVYIDSSGNFSGYAWSDNIGWINFSPEGPDYPEIPSHGTRVDLDNGQVSGWARAQRAIDDPPGPILGGWTGWINLNGVVIDETTGNFSGFAWGGGGNSASSAVIGWIDFSGVTVDPSTFLTPPNPPTNLTNNINYCSMPESPIIYFYWFYTHDDGFAQSSYEIEIGTQLILRNSFIPNNSTSSFSSDKNDLNLNWDESYNWRVTVQDINGLWSPWSEPLTLTMPTNSYPLPVFSYSPQNPSANTIISFTDNSLCRCNLGVCLDCKSISNVDYLWTFGGITSTQKGNVTTTFSNPGEYSVSLRIIDNNLIPPGPGSCTSAEIIRIRFPLPTWKEIAPF